MNRIAIGALVVLAAGGAYYAGTRQGKSDPAEHSPPPASQTQGQPQQVATAPAGTPSPNQAGSGQAAQAKAAQAKTAQPKGAQGAAANLPSPSAEEYADQLAENGSVFSPPAVLAAKAKVKRGPYEEVAIGGKDPLSQPVPGGIVWYGTWEDAIAEVERTGKPLMLHFGSPRCPEKGVNVPGTW